ncbi:MAG: hypothetical protein ABIQ27_12955 [Flavobacterium sp.]|uniref:hypothetical protein n=1 Tax=Flavobacterium sp. TaxID=239 RepID=UPI003263709F
MTKVKKSDAELKEEKKALEGVGSQNILGSDAKNLGGMTGATEESFDLDALDEKDKNEVDEKTTLGIDELQTEKTTLNTDTLPAATDEQIDMSKKVVSKPAKFLGANPVKGIFQPVLDQYGQKRFYQVMEFQEQILVKRKDVLKVVDAKHKVESGYHLNVLPNKFANIELTPLPDLMEEETKK